jgi:Xaa-Pro aminopeptidase
MTKLSLAEMEKVGDAFDEDAIVRAKKRCWEAVELAAKEMRPGMSEEEGFRLTNAILRDLGAEKNWHRSQVRFGANTLLPFGEKPSPNTVLAANDIFFLDLGPIYFGHEADCGATFTVGNDEEMIRCAKDAAEIHGIVRDHWFATGESGKALYEFARGEAKKRGWEMTLKSADGHRLGDFPHALHYKGKLASLPHKPSANRWVLEIQLRHPSRPFGAFYENLLA